MNPYFNNTPFVTGITNTKGGKDSDNSLFIIIAGIIAVGGAIYILHSQHKQYNIVIEKIRAENERLKAELIG